jgi:hypothetical protein
MCAELMEIICAGVLADENGRRAPTLPDVMYPLWLWLHVWGKHMFQVPDLDMAQCTTMSLPPTSRSTMSMATTSTRRQTEDKAGGKVLGAQQMIEAIYAWHEANAYCCSHRTAGPALFRYACLLHPSRLQKRARINTQEQRLHSRHCSRPKFPLVHFRQPVRMADGPHNLLASHVAIAFADCIRRHSCASAGWKMALRHSGSTRRQMV